MSLKALPVALIPGSAEQGLSVVKHRRVTEGPRGSFSSSAKKRHTQLYPKKGDVREPGERKAPEHSRRKGKVCNLCFSPFQSSNWS